jgi:NAD(P)-dependent dehydrogenase (short-subunit alcohol dehydrogenase family)
MKQPSLVDRERTSQLSEPERSQPHGEDLAHHRKLARPRREHYPASAERAVRSAVESFGGLDVLVNNAGYANVGTIEDTPADDFRAQVETNFFGVVNVTRAALPVLRMQRRGRIVQISTIGGRLGSAGFGAYQSSSAPMHSTSRASSTTAKAPKTRRGSVSRPRPTSRTSPTRPRVYGKILG